MHVFEVIIFPSFLGNVYYPHNALHLIPAVIVDLFLQVKESKEKEKLERRLLEELLKMFMDSESFYYSLTYDLTNSVQRQSTAESDPRPLWQKVPLTAQSRVCLWNSSWACLAFQGTEMCLWTVCSMASSRWMTDFFGINIWCKILLRLVWVVVSKISGGTYSC